MNERVEQALQAKAQELGITVDKLTDEEKTLALIAANIPSEYFQSAKNDIMRDYERDLYDLTMDHHRRVEDRQAKMRAEILALAGLKPTDAELMASETLEEARERWERTHKRKGGDA